MLLNAYKDESHGSPGNAYKDESHGSPGKHSNSSTEEGVGAAAGVDYSAINDYAIRSTYEVVPTMRLAKVLREVALKTEPRETSKILFHDRERAMAETVHRNVRKHMESRNANHSYLMVGTHSKKYF